MFTVSTFALWLTVATSQTTDLKQYCRVVRSAQAKACLAPCTNPKPSWKEIRKNLYCIKKQYICGVRALKTYDDCVREDWKTLQNS